MYQSVISMPQRYTSIHETVHCATLFCICVSCSQIIFHIDLFLWIFFSDLSKLFVFAATEFKVCGFAGSTGKRPQSRKPIKWGESTESRLSFATLDLESTNRNRRSSKSIPFFFILFTFHWKTYSAIWPWYLKADIVKKKSTWRVGSNHI